MGGIGVEIGADELPRPHHLRNRGADFSRDLGKPALAQVTHIIRHKPCRQRRNLLTHRKVTELDAQALPKVARPNTWWVKRLEQRKRRLDPLSRYREILCDFFD